jgi:hypothetical protein
MPALPPIGAHAPPGLLWLISGVPTVWPTMNIWRPGVFLGPRWGEWAQNGIPEPLSPALPPPDPSIPYLERLGLIHDLLRVELIGLVDELIGEVP